MPSPPPGRLANLEAPNLYLPVPAISAIVATAALLVQLVFARALGIVEWSGCFCGSRSRLWSTGVPVTVWFTAISVFIGVTVALRLAKSRQTLTRQAYVALLLPTMIGIMVAFPLVVALAAGANVSGGVTAGLDIGMALPMGALLGSAITVLATNVPFLARGIWYGMAWIWFLGLFSVVISWGDEVGQTVPLGGVHIGGPSAGTDVVQSTVRDVVQSLGSGIAVVGPAALAVWLTWRALRVDHPIWQAVGSAVIAPFIVVAAYLLRPDAISGANADGLGLAVKALVLAVIAAAATVFISSVVRQQQPHPRAASQRPAPTVDQRPLWHPHERERSAASSTASEPIIIEGSPRTRRRSAQHRAG